MFILYRQTEEGILFHLRVFTAVACSVCTYAPFKIFLQFKQHLNILILRNGGWCKQLFTITTIYLVMSSNGSLMCKCVCIKYSRLVQIQYFVMWENETSNCECADNLITFVKGESKENLRQNLEIKSMRLQSFPSWF